jgi:hypothetical protein
LAKVSNPCGQSHVLVRPAHKAKEREREREREKKKKEKKKKLGVWPLKVAESPPTATGVVWPPYKAKEEKIK